MWAGLTLLLALCLLHGGGAESEGGGPRCQPPPAWKIGEVDPMKESMGRVTVVALLKASWLYCLVQASRLDGLHKKLEGQGLKDVVYMVVNHHEAQAQRLHPLLEERLSQNIALYKQYEHQPDVWRTLNGEKDDFFIYDRCGRLTHHLSLPYNIIGHGHVEQAIKEAYCNRVCGECSFESADTPAECQGKDNAQPETDGAQPAGEEHQHQHPHHGHHGHNHGDNHGLHPRGFGHGHDHRRGHHHRHHHGRAETRLQEHQHHASSDQMQHAVQLEQIGQEVVGAPVRPWVQETARWKTKFTWHMVAGSENEASWCWHWRRLFGHAGSEQPLGLWHCQEELPASWQCRGLTGELANTVIESWQWRSPPAAWQQPQPAQWAWAPGAASWAWEQL